MKYAIAIKDDGITYYWTTRAGDTDNYTADVKDATLFAHRIDAVCLMKALGINDAGDFVAEID